MDDDNPYRAPAPQENPEAERRRKRKTAARIREWTSSLVAIAVVVFITSRPEPAQPFSWPLIGLVTVAILLVSGLIGFLAGKIYLWVVGR